MVILNALEGKELPIYGSGSQIRDWLYSKTTLGAEASSG